MVQRAVFVTCICKIERKLTVKKKNTAEQNLGWWIRTWNTLYFPGVPTALEKAEVPGEGGLGREAVV